MPWLSAIAARERVVWVGGPWVDIDAEERLWLADHGFLSRGEFGPIALDCYTFCSWVAV
jgi:hypothetical protein